MNTLRARLEAGLLLLLGIALIAAGVSCFLVTRQSVRTDADQFVRDKAVILAHATNPDFLDDVRYEDRAWRGDRYTPYGQTVDLEWRPRFVSSRLNAPIQVPDEVRRLARHPLGTVLHDAVGEDGVPYRMATVAIEHEGVIRGYAQIAMRMADRDAPLRRLAFTLTGIGVVTLALAWAGIHLWLQQWRTPLRTFESTAREITEAGIDRHRFVAPSDSPELETVAGSFNALLDRLVAAQDAHQQFVADASHELRTPLTVLRGELEVALRRQRSTEEYQHTLRCCREEIERLSRISDNLLALARSDGGGALNLREILDLATLGRAAADQWAPWAAEKGVRLVVDSIDSLPIRADQLAMERVLDNLIENALRFTPAGEAVTLTTRRLDSGAILEVRDAGPGISPEHLDRIFDRFYRVETFRSRERGGAGLGLAIVKSLVEAHGGTVSAESEVGVGSTFQVRIPLAQGLPA